MTSLFLLTIATLIDLSFAQTPIHPIVAEKPEFPGYMYRPDVKNKTFPAIVLLHGSEGGNGNFWQPPGFPQLPTGENTFTAQLAKHYASLGYVTYALCYFDCKHHVGFKTYPPDELVDVDIKNYVYEAFVSLKKSKWVVGKKVAVMGGSRGAELALLFAGLTEGASSMGLNALEVPDAVISESPSDFVAYPLTKESADLLSQGKPGVFNGGYSWKFDTLALPPGSTILPEFYTRPTLITYWTEDSIWGESVDIGRILLRYDQSAIPYSLIEHQTPANAQKDLEAFKVALKTNTKVFVRFVGEGHVAPQESEARKLYFSVLNEFLKIHLQ